MLPLCMKVTTLRLLAMAYSIARRTSRLVPKGEMGLMLTAESQRICFLLPASMSLFRNSSSFFTSGVPERMNVVIFRENTEDLAQRHVQRTDAAAHGSR